MATDDARGEPLIIPPPPPGAPKPEPAAPESIERPPVDSGSFISVPPSVLDSATLRIAATRAERRTPENEIVFFPSAPGTVVPDAVPAAQPTAPPASAAAPETAPSAVVLTWRLVLPDGTTVALDASVLLGRNPVATPGTPDARLVRVDDPAKSVSKTHALLELDDGRIYVHDLGSTNGVFVLEPGREVVEVRPGHRAQLSGEGDVELGEFAIQVRRA